MALMLYNMQRYAVIQGKFTAALTEKPTKWFTPFG